MIIELKDFFTYGKGFLLPRTPVSLYRYLERILELAILRKYKLKDVLEIGPGAEPIFKYLPRTECRSATLIDYHPEVLKVCRQLAPDYENLETIQENIERPGSMESLNRQWNYIICNSVLEHLIDDVTFVNNIHKILSRDGYFVCSTVMGEWLYNEWDHGVGHYRRYSLAKLKSLFTRFSEVQIIQTSLMQELVRPFFFGRLRHHQANTIEQNNWLFAEEFKHFGAPPYSSIFGIIRYFLPAYLILDWSLRNIQGGIVLVIAKK